MARLNEQFKAENDAEMRILDYLEQNASDTLIEKMNAPENKKNIQNCFLYIRNKARDKAVKGCACIEDAEVFGWAVHFFEEDSIKAAAPEIKKEAPKVATEQKAVEKPKNDVERWKSEPSGKKAEKKPAETKKEKPKKNADIDGQISFAELLGGFGFD